MVNINLELCKIFYEVAEEQNVSKAAEKLFISQPAVSQSIKKLEEQIGGTLFLRSNKGLVLTDEGKVFYNYIKGALNLVTNATIEFNNFKELKSGKIKIGTSTTLAKFVLLKPMQAFHKEYPYIKFEIKNDLTKNLLLDLEKGNLDFVIMNEGEGDNASFSVTTLREVTNMFLYSNKYFNYNDTYSLTDIQNMPLILQNKASNSRRFLDDFCLKHNVKLEPTMEVVSQELAVELAKIGFGITFAPEYLKIENLNALKLDKPLPKSKIELVTNKFYSLPFAGKKFLDYLEQKENTMNGFYIGDIIGSSYAHENSRYNKKSTNFELFTNRSGFSDDTILTFAVIDWLLHTKHTSEEMFDIIRKYYKKYPDQTPTIYGPHFAKWAEDGAKTFRKSEGNGGAMSASPIGYFAKNIEEVKNLTFTAIRPAHDTKTAIMGAEIVAISIYLLKNGYSKEELKKYVTANYNMNLDEDIETYRANYKFTTEALETVRPSLISFLHSTSFEDALRIAISFGGDSDTIATITASISEAYYKTIDSDILKRANSFLPKEFKTLLNEFNDYIKKGKK
ncbi:MAG: LysR substrate-binding domain-containing protein [Spirochaetales bacterium]